MLFPYFVRALWLCYNTCSWQVSRSLFSPTYFHMANWGGQEKGAGLCRWTSQPFSTDNTYLSIHFSFSWPVINSTVSTPTELWVVPGYPDDMSSDSRPPLDFQAIMATSPYCCGSLCPGTGTSIQLWCTGRNPGPLFLAADRPIRPAVESTLTVCLGPSFIIKAHRSPPQTDWQ